jgi:hypothetical protein
MRLYFWAFRPSPILLPASKISCCIESAKYFKLKKCLYVIEHISPVFAGTIILDQTGSLEGTLAPDRYGFSKTQPPIIELTLILLVSPFLMPGR